MDTKGVEYLLDAINTLLIVFPFGSAKQKTLEADCLGFHVPFILFPAHGFEYAS